MRTQFFLVGLLSGVAGVLVATTGCDNVTAGQTTDSSAPPQLQHVMIQDARYLFAWPNRASAVDLLDNHPMRSCQITCKGNCPGDAMNPAPPQLDTCINEFLVDQFAPDVSCQDSGVCADPLKVPASGVPIPQPALYLTGATDTRDPGGGVQVRLVFDKVLDNSIEMVTPSGSTTPGATNLYALVPGIVELDDEAGPVKSEMYYDVGGSFEFSSDLELIPLGPAIVIKPLTPLDAAMKYTVKILKPDALKDREGNAAQALGGGALPASFNFTTEQLTPSTAGNFGVSPYDYPDFTAASAVIAPDEVVQIVFFANIAGDTATVTVKSGPAGTKLLAWSDRGADPSACQKAATGDSSGIILDVANTDTGDINSAVAADWPEGDYTITVTVKDINGKSTYTADYSFTVMGPDSGDPMNPNIAPAHLTPAACSM